MILLVIRRGRQVRAKMAEHSVLKLEESMLRHHVNQAIDGAPPYAARRSNRASMDQLHQ